ncbi:hypothetical protein RchiOBHm_Chr1g0322461 [Rosa chinensis]|uniref:Urease accessory protein UreF n=1 Tax=Rosa chinensis TaxID=74649 RepID=A0A2P6S9B2_ROSCH|nr:hypothetical protein RchiOBHm_Chr1g0322461 [Rosa chinensis]
MLRQTGQWGQRQLLDSILPTGGFAHSFGLEAAIPGRVFSSPEDLQTFVIHLLEKYCKLTPSFCVFYNNIA